MNRYTFQTTIDYACCLNTLVEVMGSKDEGLVSVRGLGDFYGAEILDSLHWQTANRLYRELLEHIEEKAYESAERKYEALRDDEEQANLHDNTWIYLNLK